jgi:hypothetical protein
MTRGAPFVHVSLVALVALAAASTTATEPSVVFVDGLLSQGNEPVATVVDAHIVVRDALDHELFVDDQASIAVGADGHFQLAVDMAPVLAELEAGSVDVEVGVVESGSAGPLVIAHARTGAAFHAATATTATTATSAATAHALRGSDGAAVTSTALVARAALASPGGPTVAWSNLVNRPAGVDDGDDGNVRGAVLGLVLVGTTLTLGTLDATTIADGTVRAAAIAPATLSTTQIAGLTSADFADGGLTAADFATRSFTSADVAGNRASVFRQPAGCALPGALTTATTCPSVACATAGQVRRCSDGVCVTGSSVACSTVSVGKLLFAP